MTANRGTGIRAARREVLDVYQALYGQGLSQGTSGNVSIRHGEGMLITASGVRLEELSTADVVFVGPDGRVDGDRRPSSEALMHAGIYTARADVGAVVHCHSRYATTLACAHRPLPALHYMVGVTGHRTVPCVPYAPFGSAALADHVAGGLVGGNACLMANHGQIAVGADGWEALAIAGELEEQAAVYWGTLAIGGPVCLDDGQMDEVFRRFKNYGQQPT